MERSQLKIKGNTDNVVELLFDTPKEGESQHGRWYLYGLKHNEQEMSLFATQTLHDILSAYGRGDRLNIRKEENENGKFQGWNVIPEEGTPFRNGTSPMSNTVKATPSATETEKREYYAHRNDDLTRDIHRQVAFKEACKMHGLSGGFLAAEELAVIAHNTDNLLRVLEGEVQIVDEEKLPF